METQSFKYNNMHQTYFNDKRVKAVLSGYSPLDTSRKKVKKERKSKTVEKKITTLCPE